MWIMNYAPLKYHVHLNALKAFMWIMSYEPLYVLCDSQLNVTRFANVFPDSHRNVTRFTNVNAVTFNYRLTNMHLQTAPHL